MNAIIREERIGDCRLILGDCLEVTPSISAVDMVCTSPPYDNLRDYGAGFNGVNLFRAIELLAASLTCGGVCMWNVADATVDGSETGSSFKQALPELCRYQGRVKRSSHMECGSTGGE